MECQETFFNCNYLQWNKYEGNRGGGMRQEKERDKKKTVHKY